MDGLSLKQAYQAAQFAGFFSGQLQLGAAYQRPALIWLPKPATAATPRC